MDILSNLRQELEQEYHTTLAFLKVYPEGKPEYAPHEKSMKLGHLVTHLVDIFSWPGIVLETSELDGAKMDRPEQQTTPQGFMVQAERGYQSSMAALEKASVADLEPNWSLLFNGMKMAEWTKYGAIRHALDQIIHHRAQLGVYYRLHDIPLPVSYGPTADVQHF